MQVSGLCSSVPLCVPALFNSKTGVKPHKRVKKCKECEREEERALERKGREEKDTKRERERDLERRDRSQRERRRERESEYERSKKEGEVKGI